LLAAKKTPRLGAKKKNMLWGEKVKPAASTSTLGEGDSHKKKIYGQRGKQTKGKKPQYSLLQGGRKGGTPGVPHTPAKNIKLCNTTVRNEETTLEKQGESPGRTRQISNKKKEFIPLRGGGDTEIVRPPTYGCGGGTVPFPLKRKGRKEKKDPFFGPA